MSSQMGLSYQKKNYRPDIDGLRAIAVLSVVLFHINPELVPGGFVGVDIFFVISGFLITGNIIKDCASAEGFSWREFYRRRALRILPVLFFVLLTCLFVGHALMVPSDLEKLGWSSLASVFAAANIYFTYFQDVSYFADDSSLQPLLHLWSLGVEEQFYFVWPLLVVFLLMRLNSVSRLFCVITILAASFLLAEYLVATHPMFSYYMLPTRAGELLIGAILAIALSEFKWRPSGLISCVMGAFGATLICYSLWGIDEARTFPGLSALPSTLGAMLLIWAGSGKVVGVNRVLSIKPLVAIGLISYSLYLWHWPVLAFYRYGHGVDFGVKIGVVLFLIMVALSVASYHFVEKPFRRIRKDFKWVVIKPVATGVAIISSLSFMLIITKGAGLLYWDDEYLASLEALSPAPAAYSYPYICQGSLVSNKLMYNDACIIGSSKAEEPGVLLWGDSNAAHYAGVLGAFSEAAGFAFRNVAHSSCPPIFSGAERSVRSERLESCLRSIDKVKESLNGYQTVILGGAWEAYFKTNPDFYSDLDSTLGTLIGQGKDVVILGQIPRASNIDRSCQQKALKLLMPACGDDDIKASASPVNQNLRTLASKYEGVSYYDVDDALCDESGCRVTLNDSLLYYDNSHFSMDGSWLLGRHIVRRSGVPEAFSDLRGKLYVSDNGVRTDLNWSSFITDMGGKGLKWRGNAELQHGGASITLSDTDHSSYQSVTLPWPWEVSEGSALYLKLSLGSHAEGLPLLRLRENSGSGVKDYSAQLDCAGGRVANFGHLSRSDVSLKNDGSGCELVVRYLPSKATESLAIAIFPAIGQELWSYDKSATGSIEVEELAWAKEDIVGGSSFR